MKTGSVLPLPPHQPAEKASKHFDRLQLVYWFLLEGRKVEGFEGLPYRNLEQAANADPLIHDTMEAMGITTYTALWYNLRQAFPGLDKKAMNVKGPRDPDQARSAAKQILGRVPMKFDEAIYDAHPLTRRVLHPDYRYFFTWQQIERNMFLDGGKIEPKIWVKFQKGITQHGAPRNPVYYQLMMQTVWIQHCHPCNVTVRAAAQVSKQTGARVMQVGKAPKVMFYVFGCAAMGTLLVTIANGSKAVDSVQAGLQRWTDLIDDETKVAIMKMNYGSSEEAVQNYREAFPDDAAMVFDKSDPVAADFTPAGFLVCHSH